MSSIAVILPVHNEEWLIGSVLGQVTDFARTHRDWRFIFVDDGSSDGTPDLIREHLQQTPNDSIQLHALKPNRGKARALRAAVLETDEDLVLFTDGDLAYSLEHLDELARELENADIVIGSRALSVGPQTNITFTRRMVGTAFNRIVRLITGLPHEDTQAGLKGFQRDAARVLFRAQVVEDFAFDAELLYLAKVLNLKVVEIPANVSARHSYKKSRVNMLRDPLRMFGSLIRMRIVHRKLRKRPTQPTASTGRQDPPEIDIEPDLDRILENKAPQKAETASSKR
jgi:glycosyltransferase involved in cell wall biosynthesis